ncbi:hypothetical protein [Azonexus sp.]|uniref:hypothetical protein n=1 Tax=Azonexus sp. TaxID=1872668 RepID=UPI0035B30DD1
MYRVVTKYRNGTARPVVEHGPWHPTRQTADDWAQILRAHGYVAHIESQGGLIDAGLSGGPSDNGDLLAALSSMA